MAERLSDEQSRAILARALELDSRDPTTSVDDLRAIASDLGITPASLETALLEHSRGQPTLQIVANKRAATVVASLGLPLGLAAGSLLGSGSIFPAFALMGAGLAASSALVVFQGAVGTLRSYHLKNFMLWGGVAAGSVLAALLFGADAGRVPVLLAAGWGLRNWIASSILGSAAVIAVRRARNDTSQPDSGVDAAARSLARLVGRLLAWVKRPFWRIAIPLQDVQRA